jgi:hypothetical protein
MAKKTRHEEPAGAAGGGGQAAADREAADLGRAEKMSTREAVRRALAEDPELTAEDGAAFVRRRFGLDMTPGTFAAHQRRLQAGERRPGKGAPPPGRGKAPAGGRGDLLEAAKAVKELVDRYGADTIKGLCDLFGP